MFVVLGASGNTGKVVAETLLRQKKKVRVVLHDAAKGKAWGEAVSALLYGVGPVDPMTYTAVSITLAGVTLLATYLPARRASRVQPIIALRSRV
jgi:uncharacterized protein YbjT (DUF2867 family)